MKKSGENMLPYLAGVFFPLLFAVRALQEPSAWVKAAVWLAVQTVLTLVLEIIGRRKGLRPSVRISVGI